MKKFFLNRKIDQFQLFENAGLIIRNNENNDFVLEKICLLKNEVKWYKIFKFEIRFYIYNNLIFVSETDHQKGTTLILDVNGKEQSQLAYPVTMPPLFEDNLGLIFYSELNSEKGLVVVNNNGVLSNFQEIGSNKISKIISRYQFLSVKNNSILVEKLEQNKLINELDFSGFDFPIGKIKLTRAELKGEILIIGLDDIKNFEKYIVAVNIKKQSLLWTLKGFNNYIIEENKVTVLKFSGDIMIIDHLDGKILRPIAIAHEFEKHQINPEGNFEVIENKLLFKQCFPPKIGALNLENQKVLNVFELPKGTLIGRSDVPFLYQNKLCLYTSNTKTVNVYSLDS